MILLTATDAIQKNALQSVSYTNSEHITAFIAYNFAAHHRAEQEIAQNRITTQQER